MKVQLAIISIAFLTISSCKQILPKQDLPKVDESVIIKLIRDSFDEVWSELNADNIHKYYTNNFLLFENGAVWNNDSISNYLNNTILKQPIPKRVNSIKFIDVQINTKSAWVAYHNYATFSVDNKIIRKAHWLESARAVLTENNEWKLSMLHSTRVTNEL